LCEMNLRREVSFCVEWFWGERFLFVMNDFEERGFFLCGMILRWEVSSHFEIIKHKKKPLTSKSFNTKRNHSPQNHSTLKETSHLKIIQHKEETSHLCVDWFWVRGFVLNGMTSKWEVSFVLIDFKVRGLFCVEWF
jgi:hypothetical protein